ncbi:MAG: M16 family metallopeptidase, partial [Candidatus Hodarchaeota archaeon]
NGESSMAKIIIRSYPNLRTCTLGIVTRRGAAYDSLAGTTQVLLQTMVRGTSNYSEMDIANLIDGTGGSFFSTTEKDFAIIGAQVQPKYAERTLELLFDIILHPELEENHFLIEKLNLIQIFQQVQSNSLRRMLLFDADKAVFGETHPLGRPQIGTEESLNMISSEDLHYAHHNFLIEPWGFAIGTVPNELQTRLTHQFSTFFSNQKNMIQKIQKFPHRSVPSKNYVFSPDKADHNAYLCVNVTTEVSPDIMGLARFSSALLGESFGSRMFSVLRDKKSFGYIVGSSIKLIDTHLIIRCFMETNPKRTEEALDSLMELIIDLGINLIKNEEYQTTHDFILGTLDLSFDDSRTITGKMISREVHGLPPDIESGYEETRVVTPKKVHSWWKTLMTPENFSIAVSGNFDFSDLESKWKSQLIQ